MHGLRKEQRYHAGNTVMKNKLQRIMACFGFEGILKVTCFKHSCHEQGYLNLRHVAQKSVQPSF